MTRIGVAVLMFLSVVAGSAPVQALPPLGEGSLSVELLYPENTENTPPLKRYLLIYETAAGPPPDPYRYWRIPDRIVPVPPKGVIEVSLPAGTYWFSVAHKRPGALLGPPTQDEPLYLHADAQGRAEPITIEPGRRLVIERKRVTTWNRSRVERENGITAIEGVVTDPAGKGLGGMYVFASLNDNPMGRPLYISDPTDREGRFLLRVAGGGVYYVRARGVVGGGSPAEGEYLSTGGEFAPLMVELPTGKRLPGIRIVARLFSRRQSAETSSGPAIPRGGGSGP